MGDHFCLNGINAELRSFDSMRCLMLMRWLKKYVHLFDVGCVITQTAKVVVGVNSTSWEESEGIQRGGEHYEHRYGAKDPPEVTKNRAKKKSDVAQSVDYGLEFAQKLKINTNFLQQRKRYVNMFRVGKRCLKLCRARKIDLSLWKPPLCVYY